MSDILEKIEWALETKREKLTFGLDEKDAVYARERRLFGVLLDCKKEFIQLDSKLKSQQLELEKASELINNMYLKREHNNNCIFLIDENSEECNCGYGDIWWRKQEN